MTPLLDGVAYKPGFPLFPLYWGRGFENVVGLRRRFSTQSLPISHDPTARHTVEPKDEGNEPQKGADDVGSCLLYFRDRSSSAAAAVHVCPPPSGRT